MRRTWSNAQRNADDGAAAVEFALLFPVFIALVLGMITAGISFERWIGITQGVREGSRVGATLSVKASGDPAPPATPTNWLQAVYDSTLRATGLSGNEPGFDLCVALTPDGTNASFWHYTGTPPATAAGPCPTVTNDTQTIPRVQVVAQRTTNWNWFFVSKNVTVKSQSVTRWEPSQ